MAKVDGTPTTGTATNPAEAGVTGVDQAKTAQGLLGGKDPVFNASVGAYGSSPRNGVFGHTASDGDCGVFGLNDGSGSGVGGVAKGKELIPGHLLGHGVQGVLGADPGIFGMGGAGVMGMSNGAPGVVGVSSIDSGVFGLSSSGAGVSGQNPISDTTNTGVLGQGGAIGVFGMGHTAGVKGVDMLGSTAMGVLGESSSHDGVHGTCHHPGHAGVSGVNDAAGIGSFGMSNGHDGVQGLSSSPNHSGVAGINNGGGIGVFGAGRIAGMFAGDVEVTGDIRLLHQDVAEDFDIGSDAAVAPGAVMVFDREGKLHPCLNAYDKKVAGVVAGAGAFKPAIVLGKISDGRDRLPIALLGKAYCYVDASYGPVEVGDLLTTSPTLGHAMKAADAAKAFGAVIGKALQTLDSGQALVPILIALQ